MKKIGGYTNGGWWKEFDNKSGSQTLSLWFDPARWGIQFTVIYRPGFNLLMAEFLCVGIQYYVNTMPVRK